MDVTFTRRGSKKKNTKVPRFNIAGLGCLEGPGL